MAELIFHRAGEPILRLPIDRDRLELGSGAGNHVVLPDPGVPEAQVRLELRPQGWWLRDLSGTGTEVDQVIVATEAPLTDGCLIRLGRDWTASFRAATPTSPGETRRAAAGATLARPVGELPGQLRVRWENRDGEQRLRLGQESVGIGTDRSNQVVLDDEYVSAFHARLTLTEGLWHLRDLGSTNGTSVGGVQITEAVLLPGAWIRIGETDLVIEEDRDADLAPHGIVSQDSVVQSLLEQIERVSASDATVTLFGESGTGKELFAHAVHLASERRAGPFIPVNCAAISKELMESELFGHEKGAFTGAGNARKGAFEEADGGTLFLDEVGELPLDVQAKLLRAIELKEIRRVGSSRPQVVDARIVAATNRDLHGEVQRGRFREDLFYRLYVVPLTLPPLRRRKDDIALLAEHFLRSRSARTRPPVLTKEAKAKLLGHPWPGNVRELKNTIERAILFCRGGRIDAADVTFPDPMRVAPEEGLIQAVGKTLVEIEYEAIRIALKANHGNRRLTAQMLGMARSTLQVRLKDLGLAGETGAESEA